MKKLLSALMALMLVVSMFAMNVTADGATVYVSLNDECIGYIGVGDNIKENGKKAFDDLRKSGIKKIFIPN